MSTIFQSSYTRRPEVAYLGQPASLAGGFRARGRIARGFVKAGYGVFKVPSFGSAGDGVAASVDPGEVYQIPNPAAAADVDAIIATIASAAAEQTLSGSDLDGAVAGTQMYPGRQVTLVLSNHTDWDATTAVLTGVSALTGQTITEDISIPNGGNATVTSTNYFLSVTSLYIPAQTGAGGTATLGIAALTSLTAAYFDGVAIRSEFKTTQATNSLYALPGVSTTTVTADYIEGETVEVMNEGGIWVYTESAVTEVSAVYVRIASGSGGSQPGAFRIDDDTSTAVELKGAKWLRKASAGGLAKLFLPASYHA